MIGLAKLEALVAKLYTIAASRDPDAFAAVQVQDITQLLEVVEGAIPALDRLQEHLAAGAKIAHQEGLWCLFDARGEGIAAGKTLRMMLLNLVFAG